MLGDIDGSTVGLREGLILGMDDVGTAVGAMVGANVGEQVGDTVGSLVG
jgi:hypothetical protein